MNHRPTVAALSAALIYCLLVASCTGVPAAMLSGENTAADISHNGSIITVDPSVTEAAAVSL